MFDLETFHAQAKQWFNAKTLRTQLGMAGLAGFMLGAFVFRVLL